MIGGVSSVTLKVELSWDGGTTWTSGVSKTYTNETPTDATQEFGRADFKWNRTWTEEELRNANFIVRTTVSNLSGTAQSGNVDHIQARINFTSDDIKLEGGVKANKVVLIG